MKGHFLRVVVRWAVVATLTIWGRTTSAFGEGIYWTTQYDRIQKANLDGSGVVDLVTTGQPRDLELDDAAGHIYWTDNNFSSVAGKIRRANLDGSGIVDIVTSLAVPRGLALDVVGGRIYWIDGGARGRGRIRRVDLDGSGGVDLVSGLTSPQFLALDIPSGHMYWTDTLDDRIQRANLDGSGIVTIVSGLPSPIGIALDIDSEHIYWAENGVNEIQRASLDGLGVTRVVSTGNLPAGIALDTKMEHVYWAGNFIGMIQRVNFDGSAPTNLIDAPGVYDVALDLEAPVMAQEITFDFTGVVNRVDDAFAGGPFEIGQAVSGSYTFEAPAADQDLSPVVGLYENVLRFELSVPAASYDGLGEAGSRPGTIHLLDDQDGVRDRYSVYLNNPEQNVSGPAVAGATLEGFSLVLRDRTTLALSSDGLPLSPPSLADFAFGNEVEMRFFKPCDPAGGPCGDVLVGANLTTLNLSSVTSILNDLVQHVTALNLQRGVSNSFDAKLEAVMRAIDDSNENNDVAAENAMYAFISAVEAQRGKGLSDAETDQLVGIAQAVIAALGN